MSSAVYPLIRQQLVQWAVTAGATFYTCGVKSGYVYNSAHDDLADISSGDICLPEKALTGVTFAGGILDADNPTWTGLVPGDTVKAIIIYAKLGGNSYLVAYLDDTVDTSLPLLIASSSVTITFNAAGICKL